jgi:hypothetical protein
MRPMLEAFDDLSISDIEHLLKHLSQAEIDEIQSIIDDAPIWLPIPGPQVTAYLSNADIIGFGGAAGGGKGLALDTPIPTPTGWSTMMDLSAGNELFDDAGNICRVVAVSEINHRPCYRLVFDDGSELIADDVHRWITFDSKELAALTRRDPSWREARRLKRQSRAKESTSAARLNALAKHNSAIGAANSLSAPEGTMRDTLEISNSVVTSRGRRNHAIKVCGALQTPISDLIVPPYTLGAWLGDGASANGQITSADDHILSAIRDDGYEVRSYSWSVIQHSIIGLKVKLRQLGVLNNKHIPAAYLRASYEQRLALLQGLMDTDGHAALDGGCEYDGISETLVRGVFELVMSLGIKATLQKGKARLNGRVISDKWRVKFTTKLPVFRLPRKCERLRDTRRTAKFRYIVSCERIDSVPTRCISVDSPSHMYLAGKSMIPTHNSDLALGKALTQHEKAIIFRREATQLTGIIGRLEEILGNRDGYNGQEKIWRNPVPGKQIEFGSVPNLGDETKYQGRPHDLIVFDEAANFLEYQVRFLMGWLRTTTPGQKCQALMTFNPPTTAEGRWIINFFAPWLDPKFPEPALPGELRYAASLTLSNGTSRDLWVDGPDEFVLYGGEPLYEFMREQYQPQDIIKPMARTFIPSKVSDNPFLVGTGYMSQLQALPEPLRSQMLYGDFMAGVMDDPWQVIPTAWVDAAMERWTDRSPKGEMDSMGVDVARGGQDSTIIMRRHGMWLDRPLAYPGAQTPDGPAVAGLVIAALRDNSPIHIDVIGVGSSPYDFLVQANQQIEGVNVAERAVTADGSPKTDKSGRLRFFNQRAELWWMMREALDPTYDTGIALPPDPRLKADLLAPRWRMKDSATIQVESREDIIKRTGKSPDYGSAAILALIDTKKISKAQMAALYNRKRSWRA